MNNFLNSKIKVEAEDNDVEVDVARGRFESALLDLINKDDLSESENGSDSDVKDRPILDTIDILENRESSLLPNSSRPVRKRRRKETELRDGGFHHTFVMRMFDRSVDLAQFEEHSPLYPICRAWMLNQPHNSDLSVKQEPASPLACMSLDDIDKKEEDVEFPNVTSMPLPDSWIESDDSMPNDPRIPKPLPPNVKKLNHINEEAHVTPALLLTQHLHRWRAIRNQWKKVGQRADSRYMKSYMILKTMFERGEEKDDFWNVLDERKDGLEAEEDKEFT